MAGQRTLWGYEVGEAVEVLCVAPLTFARLGAAESVKHQTWQIGTVETVNRGFRGLGIRMAEDQRLVAVSDPRGLRSVPKTGEDFEAWLES